MKITTEILLEYISGKSTQEQSNQIIKWIEDSKDNKNKYLELKLYSENKYFNPTPKKVDVNSALSKLNSKIDTSSKQKGKKIALLFKYAASIAILVSVGLGFYLNNSNKVELVSVVNKTSKPKVIILSDHSKVTLAKGAKLLYPENFKGKLRNVELKGEAFFNIHRNTKKPFIIKALKTNIKVLGTSFKVDAKNKFVEVKVKTGKVQFYETLNPKNSVILTKNKGAIFSENSFEQTQISNQDNFKLNTLIFENQTLEEIINDLNKKFDKNIKINNQAIKKLRLTATYQNIEFEKILEAISFSLNVKLEKSKSEFTFK